LDVMLDLVIPNKIGMPDVNSDIAVVYSKPEVIDLISDLLWHVRLISLLFWDELRSGGGCSRSTPGSMTATVIIC